MNKKLMIAAAIAIAAVPVAACSSTQPSGNAQESQAQQRDANTLVANQPIPIFQSSEARANLIAIEEAQAHGVATTTFFFNQGVQNPVFTCPSIGYAIPSTAQLSNPHQVIYTNHPNGGMDGNVLEQMDPTGIYTGDSTGTYVECVSANGTKYPKYWEGFVDVIGGPAHWDAAKGQEVLDGPPTVVTKK